jgi:hypothetical protein
LSQTHVTGGTAHCDLVVSMSLPDGFRGEVSADRAKIGAQCPQFPDTQGFIGARSHTFPFHSRDKSRSERVRQMSPSPFRHFTTSSRQVCALVPAVSTTANHAFHPVEERRKRICVCRGPWRCPAPIFEYHGQGFSPIGLRRLTRTNLRLSEKVPQGLKPQSSCSRVGTTEFVP